jgi:hypothetical protein
VALSCFQPRRSNEEHDMNGTVLNRNIKEILFYVRKWSLWLRYPQVQDTVVDIATGYELDDQGIGVDLGC